jgi:hypothetical protein
VQLDPPSALPSIVAYVGLIAAVGIYLFHVSQFWHYINDDAYITFRYSRFLATGRGPYFNVGEHVEGYTNFLLMLILAPVYSIGGENALPVFAKFLSAGCGILSIIAAFFLARLIVPQVTAGGYRSAMTAVVAAGLVATSAGYAINSTSGLETILFSATLVLGVLLGQLSAARGRWLGSGVLFALAALTRPEGACFFAVYWMTQLGCQLPVLITNPKRSLSAVRESIIWRQLLPDAVIVTVVFVFQLLYRHAMYDGEWLPNTYHAKAGGFWAASAGQYINDNIVGAVLGPIGLWAGLIGWLFASGARLKSLPVLAVAAAGSLMPFVTGTDWMLGGRMVVPFIPLLAVCLSLGWCRLLDLGVGRRMPPALLALILILPASWNYQQAQRSELISHSLYRAHGYEIGHRALAEYLRAEAAKPGDTIAMMDIGIVGYYCDQQKILDITGLTDRHIGKSPGTFLGKEYDPSYVLEKHPEFIVLVLSAAGNPDNPLPRGSRLGAWTTIEGKIAKHGDFDRFYRNRRMGGPEATWLESIASDIGADRIFEHKHPGLYYLLAVFRRHA